jgi:predicted Zn finger-like uncharacterized protein
MVVTCPSCSARYRLNPDKMKGRGAKITCPKCAHVFVVFADGAGGPASDDPEGGQESPLAAEDTLRERLARRDLLTTNSALEALGLEGDVDTSQTSAKIRVVAPGPRGSREPIATLDTNRSFSSVGEDSVGGDSIEEEAVEEDDEPDVLDANELDFREVGIATWKVKVAIGLVYDFSDVATLKRYLADKRVTPSDLLSPNGKDWTVIGDIPDLDTHFIDTWKAARAERKASGPKETKKKSGSATKTGGYGSSTGSMAALSPSGRHQTMRTRPKRKRPPKKEEKKSGGRGFAMVLGLAVLAGALYWVTATPELSSGSQTAPVQRTSPLTNAGGVTDTEQDRIRKGVKDEVARQREKMIAEEREAAKLEDAAVEEIEEDGQPDFSKMVAVRPENQTTKVGSSSALPRPQAGSRPMAKSSERGALRAPSALTGSVATSSVRRDDGGDMWLTQGRKALASGNYGTAKSMFQQCVSKNAGAGECWAGLGQSLQRMGEASKAEEAFSRAESLGVRVNRSSP